MRSHDFFWWRGCLFFCVERLHFVDRLHDFFVWRGCMIFSLTHSFPHFFLEAAWFFVLRGCVIFLTHSLRFIFWCTKLLRDFLEVAWFFVFSQNMTDRRTNRLTDRRTTILLEVLRAAKKVIFTNVSKSIIVFHGHLIKPYKKVKSHHTKPKNG